MPPTTYTTQDLRAALQASADTVGDLSELRQRLDYRLDEATSDEPVHFVPVVGEPAPVPLRRAGRAWSGRSAQCLTGAVLAACIAALAFVVIQAPWHTSPNPTTHSTSVVLPTPDPQVTVPSGLRNSFNPGSIPLRNFAGTGTKRIDLGAVVTVPHHTYSLYYTCSGGSIQITDFGESACGKRYGGIGNPGPQRHVRVLTGRDVSWHLLLVLEPIRTATHPDACTKTVQRRPPPHAATSSEMAATAGPRADTGT